MVFGELCFELVFFESETKQMEAPVGAVLFALPYSKGQFLTLDPLHPQPLGVFPKNIFPEKSSPKNKNQNPVFFLQIKPNRCLPLHQVNITAWNVSEWKINHITFCGQGPYDSPSSLLNAFKQGWEPQT